MTKYKAKMIETSESVTAFIKSVPDKQKQEDSFALIEILKKMIPLSIEFTKATGAAC